MKKEKIEEYLKVLACPLCKSELFYREIKGKQGFFCPRCSLFYPIVDEIPVMLPEEAIKLNLSKENESSCPS